MAEISDMICLPPKVVADTQLPAGAKLVLALLVSRFNSRDKVCVESDDISATLGIGCRTLFRHLKLLCDAGLLERVGATMKGGYRPILPGGTPTTPTMKAWETANSLPKNIEEARSELRTAGFAIRRAERQMILLEQKCDRRKE